MSDDESRYDCRDTQFLRVVWAMRENENNERVYSNLGKWFRKKERRRDKEETQRQYGAGI